MLKNGRMVTNRYGGACSFISRCETYQVQKREGLTGKKSHFLILWVVVHELLGCLVWLISITNEAAASTELGEKDYIVTSAVWRLSRGAIGVQTTHGSVGRWQVCDAM